MSEKYQYKSEINFYNHLNIGNKPRVSGKEIGRIRTTKRKEWKKVRLPKWLNEYSAESAE